MKNENERCILSILFVVAGVVAFALLAWWLSEGRQEAMRPTRTDWPEWQQKEWERKQREEQKAPPQYPQPTNYEVHP